MAHPPSILTTTHFERYKHPPVMTAALGTTKEHVDDVLDYCTRFVVAGVTPSDTAISSNVFKCFLEARDAYIQRRVFMDKSVWTTKFKNRSMLYSHSFVVDDDTMSKASSASTPHPVEPRRGGGWIAGVSDDNSTNVAHVYLSFPRHTYSKCRMNVVTKKCLSGQTITFTVQWAGGHVFCKFFRNGRLQLTGLRDVSIVSPFAASLVRSFSTILTTWAAVTPTPLPDLSVSVFLINEGCRLPNFDITKYCRADRTARSIVDDVVASTFASDGTCDGVNMRTAYIRLNSLFLHFMDVKCIVRCKGYCFVTRKSNNDPQITHVIKRLLFAL